MPTLVRLATRGISAIVAATVVIGGWSAVTASPASAGQAYVASYNMCVDYCHRPGTLQYRDGNAVDYAYNQIVNSPTTPWIVGLQETCTLSMWDLGNRLQSRGWSGTFSMSPPATQRRRTASTTSVTASSLSAGT